MIHFLIKRDVNGYPFAVLKAANGETVCITESYSSKENAIKAINFIKSFAIKAPVYEE